MVISKSEEIFLTKGEISINKNKKNAQLDYDKIQFPITYKKLF